MVRSDCAHVLDYIASNISDADLRVLDTETLTWNAPRTRGYNPAPRHFHTSSAINNVMYIFGGYDGDDWRNDTVGLDLATLTWHNIAFIGPLPPVRASHSSSVITGNKVRCFTHTYLFRFNLFWV